MTPVTKPIMVIIDEAKWCRNVVAKFGGERCALGWLAECAGEQLPRAVVSSQGLVSLVRFGYAWRDEVINANDHLTGDARKLKLTRLFREQGMVLCFVDSSKPQAVEEPVKGCSWVTV